MHSRNLGVLFPCAYSMTQLRCQVSGLVNGICDTNYLREGTVAVRDGATAAAMGLKPELRGRRTEAAPFG